MNRIIDILKLQSKTAVENLDGEKVVVISQEFLKELIKQLEYASRTKRTINNSTSSSKRVRRSK